MYIIVYMNTFVCFNVNYFSTHLKSFETYESHSGYCFKGCFAEKYLGLTNSNQAAHH